MVTIEQAETYLRVVGRLMPPEADDRVWLLVMANAFANGLIRELDWDTQQGAVAISLIEDVYPAFAEWVKDEEIDLTLF